MRKLVLITLLLAFKLNAHASTILAFDSGWNATNATAAFQADINSVADTIKHMINWPQSHISGAPANLIDHWDYIETLPFDGVVIFIPTFRNVMSDSILTYQSVYHDSKLSQLAEKFDKVHNNFLMAWSAAPPLDAFDNWDQIFANFAVYARAAHDAGCSGIVFDDEQYYRDYSKPDGKGGIWEYPLDVKYSSIYTAAEYRVQMRLRGRQMMEAMIAQFPDIQIIVTHGPYWSEPQAFIDLPKLNEQIPAFIQGEKMLVGSLFAGFVEASVVAKGQGHSPKVIDGGEIYSTSFTRAEYKQKYYDWRKYTIASNSVNSLSIPESLRPDWPDNVSISYGLYNKWGMTSSILRKAIEYSLSGADDLIWYYSEDQDWYVPGAIPEEWMDAVTDGFAAGQLPVVLAKSITVIGADNQTTITTKDGTLQMSAIFTPDNSSDKLIYWKVTNKTGKAKIDQNGLLTARGDGTVIVKATVMNNATVTGELIVTISNQLIISVSETGANNSTALSIYPNPLIHDLLTIDFGKKISGVVSIFDVSGKLIFNVSVDNSERTQIEAGMLSKGILIVKAFIDGHMKVMKLIVE